MLFEALVKITDNVNTNLSDEKQITALWKRGDIVVVKPKGWSWGREEVKHFLIVTLPEDWTEEECYCMATHMLVEGEKVSADETDIIPTPTQQVVCRSRYSIDIDEWLERCCDSESGLEGQELLDLKTAARARMNDTGDEYQPVKEFKIHKDCVEDKDEHPTIRVMYEKIATRLKTDFNKNVRESKGNIVPRGITVKAKGLSQTESRAAKIAAKVVA